MAEDPARFGLSRLAESDVINTIAAVLLISVVAICVAAFPFVLWMLFGDAPRSGRKRHASRPRGNGATGSSGRSDDRKKAMQRHDEADD
jgi:hypothetical protein